MAFKLKFKHKRRYHKRSKFGLLKLKKQTIYTVAAIWFWLFAIAISLSFFGETAWLTSLRESLVNHFGWVVYLIPIFLVSASTLFFKVKSDLGNQHVPMGLGIVLVGLLALTRAGDIGDGLSSLTSEVIAPEGSTLLFLALVLIGFIVLFNTSLDRVINFLLMGAQAIFEWLMSLGKGRKSELVIGGRKDTLRIRDSEKDAPLFKAPVTPPPVPTRPGSGAKSKEPSGDIATPTAASVAQDMKLWEYPTVELLSDGPGDKADRGDMRKNADTIEKTLDSFGIQAKVVEVNPGPAVTHYCLKPA